MVNSDRLPHPTKNVGFAMTDKLLTISKEQTSYSHFDINLIENDKTD